MVKLRLVYFTAILVIVFNVLFQWNKERTNKDVSGLQGVKLDQATQAPLVRIYPGIVHIINPELSTSCSGVVIDDNILLTAAHCLNEEGVMSKAAYLVLDTKGNDTGVTATPGAMNMRRDFGVLVGDFRLFNLIPVNFRYLDFSKEESYITCGFPWADKELHCTPFVYVGQFYFNILGSAAVYPGMSGGPLLKSSTGEVIGVVSGVSGKNAVMAPIFKLDTDLEIR